MKSNHATVWNLHCLEISFAKYWPTTFKLNLIKALRTLTRSFRKISHNCSPSPIQKKKIHCSSQKLHFSQHFDWINLDHYAMLICGGFANPKLQIPLHFPTNKFKRLENHLVGFITAMRPFLSQIFWISYYSIILITIFIKSTLQKKNEILFVPQFECRVHHGNWVTEAGISSNWSQFTCSQESASEEWYCSGSFLLHMELMTSVQAIVLPIYRMGFATSKDLINIISYKNSQSLI